MTSLLLVSEPHHSLKSIIYLFKAIRPSFVRNFNILGQRILPYRFGESVCLKKKIVLSLKLLITFSLKFEIFKNGAVNYIIL